MKFIVYLLLVFPLLLKGQKTDLVPFLEEEKWGL